MLRNKGTMKHSAKLDLTDYSIFFLYFQGNLKGKLPKSSEDLGGGTLSSNCDSLGRLEAMSSPHLSSWKLCICPNRAGRIMWSVFFQWHTEGKLLWLKIYVCQLKFSNLVYDSSSKFLSRISKIKCEETLLMVLGRGERAKWDQSHQVPGLWE